jgi:rubrerythrin
METEMSTEAPTSLDWCSHFLRNRIAANKLPWDGPYRLSAYEKIAISASIQQFQLGEGSSGRRLLARGAEFASRTNDPRFVSALRLFIREERRHSRYLARFMHQQQIPCVKTHWIDSAFRGFRHLAGLELSLRVLCTAEIIAVPYYRALAHATASPLLHEICRRILADEAGHLRYQSWMMARLNRQRLPTLQRINAAAHKLFLLGTCGIVWREHGPVFRAASCTFRRLVKESFAEFAGLQLAQRESAERRFPKTASTFWRPQKQRQKSY